MMHLTFADKDLILGTEAAELVVEYAAALARQNTADTVRVNAYGADGSDPVVLDADGFYKVIDGPFSTGQHEIGHLTSFEGDQTYDLTSSRQQLRTTQSLTIYDYAAAEALGSVNVGPVG